MTHRVLGDMMHFVHVHIVSLSALSCEHWVWRVLSANHFRRSFANENAAVREKTLQTPLQQLSDPHPIASLQSIFLTLFNDCGQILSRCCHEGGSYWLQREIQKSPESFPHPRRVTRTQGFMSIISVIIATDGGFIRNRQPEGASF